MYDEYRHISCDNRQMNINAPNSSTIGMLLLPGFNSMAAHAFLDPFRAANYLQGNQFYRWEIISLDGKKTTASNGMVVARTTGYYDLESRPDLLVVNASWTPEKFQGRKLQSWLKQLAQHGATMLGIDTGAFVLAFAGLLEGYRATVHFEHHAAFTELFPYTKIEQVLYVVDRNRLTCCGGLAAADLALELIRIHHGIDLANAAANYIFQDRLRSGEENQLSRNYQPVGYSIPKLLREAMVLMERNLEEPLRLAEIAQYLEISQRQLERLFKRYTGVTPIKYYINLRLDRARGLITQTEMSIVEIANACGFGTAEQFTRTYKKRFGIVPSIDRIEGRIPFSIPVFSQSCGDQQYLSITIENNKAKFNFRYYPDSDMA